MGQLVTLCYKINPTYNETNSRKLHGKQVNNILKYGYEKQITFKYMYSKNKFTIC